MGPLLEPVEGETVSEVAAARNVRTVTLMTFGIVELWSGLGDAAQRHLDEAVALARTNGPLYVEMGCLCHLAVAVGRRSPTRQRELAAQAVAIMEEFRWMSEPVAPMVLAAMDAVDVWQGRFDDAQHWLDTVELDGWFRGGTRRAAAWALGAAVLTEGEGCGGEEGGPPNYGDSLSRTTD